MLAAAPRRHPPAPPPATPFHTSEWFRAAGITPAVLAADDGSAELMVWEPQAEGHYYHSARELLTGGHERAFMDQDPAVLRAALGGIPIQATISPYGYRGGPSTAPGCTQQTLNALATRLVEQARRRGARMILSHYLYADEDGPWIRALMGVGGMAVVMGAHCRMDVQWPDMEAYFKWLGKNRRTVRAPKAWGDSDAIWTVREAPGTDPEDQDAGQLFAAQAARFDSDPPPKALLSGVAGGERFPRVLLSCRQDGQPVRSALAVLASGNELYPKFFGTRAPRQDYVPLVFNRLTQFAIERGYGRINYGGGAHQAKLLRGARLIHAWGVLVILDGQLERLVRPWAQRLGAAKQRYFDSLSATWQMEATGGNAAWAQARTSLSVLATTADSPFNG